MHTREALAAGESELRLTMLAAWEESPLYSDRERAALAWTEALTLLPETGAPDDVYAEFQAQFTPEEQVKITMLIGIINAWNRFGAGFRAVHPLPRPAQTEKAAA
jgi:alkylhydroperoxidase family enzyme